ncbi:response regulator [Maribacter sp. 2307ULW6-5]|uniref:response regulator n=1 Tax=Maribacter sp. 2307ULW6-5 TaxID=3386275 RepID=UPI0039BC8AB2
MSAKNILLVDDSEIDNFIHETLLKKLDVVGSITVKISGGAALEYLKELRGNTPQFPDIIFLDIRMPVMDGFAFMDAYRQLFPAATKPCRVYMLSSSLDPGDRERAAQYHEVCGFLSKPLAHQPYEDIIGGAAPALR